MINLIIIQWLLKNTFYCLAEKSNSYRFYCLAEKCCTISACLKNKNWNLTEDISEIWRPSHGYICYEIPISGAIQYCNIAKLDQKNTSLRHVPHQSSSSGFILSYPKQLINAGADIYLQPMPPLLFTMSKYARGLVRECNIEEI